METTKMSISTDYRIELFSLIGFLSDIEGHYTFDYTETEYTNRLNECFSDFSNHKAVKEFPKIWENGLCWDAIPFLAFHLDNNFEFKSDFEISKRLIARYDNNFKEVTDYLIHVKDFAKVSNFKDFYNKYAENILIEEVSEEASKIDYRKSIEGYLKLKLYDSKVILSNLFISSFGVTMEYEEKKIYSIIGGGSIRMAKKNNGFRRVVHSIIWHEFLHSVVNPLSDRLFSNPLEKNDEQVEWYCQLNESIIWAITFRLLVKHKILQEAHKDWYYNNAIRNGAPKAGSMNELLIDYENGNYSNFEDFYPRLQKLCGSIPR